MYSGWLHSVFVTGTICLAADGCIIWSRHNCPGSWNDSDTSLGFRVKLLDPAFFPDTRMNVVSDSAFPCSIAMAVRILTSLKDGDLERILLSLRASTRTFHNAITSVRQAPSGAWVACRKSTPDSSFHCRTTPSSEASAWTTCFAWPTTGSERWESRTSGPHLRARWRCRRRFAK
ncbi:hypothetical protein PF010_g3843 [Phytophthora fragariae]|uniref:DDE Tnp4 domain-containing protein n=1 Tax=Phytophthora fragariae TaxID=53985 RepID=A0A6G0PDM9_9STRA|nr:hypothetical protein PF010_g3843 [Phytophthora fragariae]KAE9243285.1 hypothetical protein PF004_g6222 [Phytophthora fragariae]KAE9350357.1 hypothetical protein PF008_g6478 [Phytophthora fragariae]